jgi:hypothetical protein
MSERKSTRRSGRETKEVLDTQDHVMDQLLRIQMWITEVADRREHLEVPHSQPTIGDTTQITRLIGRNPGPLADILRGIETRLMLVQREGDQARQTLSEINVQSESGLEGRAIASLELQRATEKLTQTQRQLYELIKNEKSYLDTLLRNSHREVASEVSAHLRPTVSTSNNALATSLVAVLDRRTVDEMAWQRADDDMRRRSQVDVSERKATLLAIVKKASETVKRLVALSQTCVRELAYEERIANELPEDGVDETGIIERCKTTREPTLKNGRVCHEAETWRSDKTCTAADVSGISFSGNVVPANQRIRLRFRLHKGPAHARDLTTVTRCFDIAALKYLVATDKADGEEVRDLESGIALSDAQLRRIAAVDWPVEATDLVDDVWREFRTLLESKRRSAKVVQRRAELARLLVWLDAGSPNFPVGIVRVFPRQPHDLAYTDDLFWYKLAFSGTPTELMSSEQPPITTNTRRQRTYSAEEDREQEESEKD